MKEIPQATEQSHGQVRAQTKHMSTYLKPVCLLHVSFKEKEWVPKHQWLGLAINGEKRQISQTKEFLIICIGTLFLTRWFYTPQVWAEHKDFLLKRAVWRRGGRITSGWRSLANRVTYFLHSVTRKSTSHALQFGYSKFIGNILRGPQRPLKQV